MIKANDARDITAVAQNDYADIQPWIDVDHVSLALAEVCEDIIKAAQDGAYCVNYEVDHWSNLCFYKIREILEAEGYKLEFDTSENHCWLMNIDWSC